MQRQRDHRRGTKSSRQDQCAQAKGQQIFILIKHKMAKQHSDSEYAKCNRCLGRTNDAAPGFFRIWFQRPQEFPARLRGKEGLQTLRRANSRQKTILCNRLPSGE